MQKSLICVHTVRDFYLGQLDSNQRMQESKSCALPLGDDPLMKYPAAISTGYFLIRVDKGIRTLGLQSHNLAR